jgi:hypothetical protein
MVVVAQALVILPRPVFVSPEVNKARFACSIRRFRLRVDKAVHAHLNRSIAFHVNKSSASLDQDPLRVARADVVFSRFRSRRVTERYAAWSW